MLAQLADIVFLVDESGSDAPEFSWIADVVNRLNGLDDYLANPLRNIDARYGLVGFGDDFAEVGHSHLLGGNKLFGTAAELASVVTSLTNNGSAEAAWDAMEHTIAEYEFRPGAAVIFVVFRRDDLNANALNFDVRDKSGPELTRAGTLAALKSYNVTLNSVVETTFDPRMYTSGGIVLGVEADRLDWVEDGRHIAHVVNGIANRPTEPDILVVSENGTNSTTYVDSLKSIRISTNDNSQIADIAGPNLGGYRAEAATYSFEDISTTGTLITGWTTSVFNNTNRYKQLNPSGFAFPFYGTTYSSLYINSEGAITFDGPSEEGQPSTWAGEPDRQPRIAALWDEYDVFAEPFNTYWQIKEQGTVNERLIVQWEGYNHHQDAGTGSSETVTFQAVLYENGEIRLNYKDLSLTDSSLSAGQQATVGISGEVFLTPDIVPAGVFVDGAHEVETTQFFGAESDFVRLSWATGGAAWNNEVISIPSSPHRTAFDTAFIQSIAQQISDKHARGDVVFADEPVVQINMGGSAVGGYIADSDPILSGFLPNVTSYQESTTTTIVKNGNSMAGDANTLAVFKSARRWDFTDVGGIDLQVPATIVPNGRYVVELMFAALPNIYDEVTVTFENATEPVLKNYFIEQDLAKIPTTHSGSPQFEVLPEVLGELTPAVKRYSVDVVDGDGLTINLERWPMLNGLRILKTPPPRVKDVVIRGVGDAVPEPDIPAWAAGVEYSFQELIANGMQLRPIPTENANRIEIHFDSPVSVGADDLHIYKTVRKNDPNPNLQPDNFNFLGNASGINFNYDQVNYIATWTFPAFGNHALVDGKYSIHLSGVTGGGQSLDGDWENDFGGSAAHPTADDFTDDPQRRFLSGDGTADSGASAFRLNFALLAGDYNGDGVVNSATDLVTVGDRWSDGDGDGQIETTGDDLAIRNANANDFLPLRKLHGGDFIDDDRIDGKDLMRWRVNYAIQGSAFVDGDIDGDNDVDGTDLLLWQNLNGSYSAWAALLPGVAASSLVGTAAPKVMNVIISGSVSTHAPFSFDIVDGSGDQLRTVPVGGADTISIVFSEAVNVSANDLIVVGLKTFNVPELVEFSYDQATHTASWRYEGWSLADNYLLALSDTVTDIEGNWLDGEWVNPASVTTVNAAVSEFPSGDGTPGGWFTFAMTLLPGDANLDGIVNGSDFSIMASNWGATMNKLFAEGDFDGDGAVNSNDYDLLALNFNRNLQTLKLKADFDGDFDVDDWDLKKISDNAGMTGATWADGDLNGDGTVDLDDLDLALAQYGLGLNVVS
jgi:hypothetical protein